MAGASTAELVDVAARIAAELAQRTPPESAAACLELTKALAAATDHHEAAIAGMVGVIDRAGEAKRWGYPSTRSWLRSVLGMRDARASERLTLARQRDRLPQVTKRFAGGDLSFGYAATVADAVQTARITDPGDVEAAERILLELADQGFAPGKLAAFGRRIRELVAERDGTAIPDEDVRRGHEDSWTSVARSLDGGVFFRGYLTPEHAAVWDTTVTPLAKPAGPGDTRDTAHRTADALIGILSGGHAQAKVTVVVDLDTLTGGAAPARLANGTPLPPEQARRIALSAGVSPLLLGKGTTPLYLGHRVRFASPAQRQVLETLYPTCAVRECEIPGTACEVDHVDGWALGRSPTDIDRLALCCGFHNRFKATHPNQIHIGQHSDGRYVYRLLPPDDLGRGHPIQREGP